MWRPAECGERVGIVVYYYSLTVMLLGAVAGTTCVAAFIVSRHRECLWLGIALIAYFFDVGLVFRTTASGGLAQVSPYQITGAAESVVLGVLVFGSIWIAVLTILQDPLQLAAFPVAIFCLGSVGLYVGLPAGPLREFLFFSMRGLFEAMLLSYIGVRYATMRGRTRLALRRYALFYAGAWTWVLLTVAENIYFQLLRDYSAVAPGRFVALPERNVSENMLLLWIAYFAVRLSIDILRVRYEKPPSGTSGPVERRLSDAVELYAEQRDLSAREREVLRLVLDGRSTQEIADQLFVSPSTVKVHVHHILAKTGRANRAELVKDFWSHA